MAETKNDSNKVEKMINDLVERAKKASEEYMKLNQEQVDKIVKAMSIAGLEHHMELAKLAVEETGRGIYEDKIIKNMFATDYIYNNIKNEKTVGIIEENIEDDYGIQNCWNKMIDILSKDINETVAYLENCSEEDIYFISEVFEDVSEQLQSKEYIECLRKLDDKFPNLDMTKDINLAEEYI